MSVPRSSPCPNALLSSCGDWSCLRLLLLCPNDGALLALRSFVNEPDPEPGIICWDCASCWSSRLFEDTSCSSRFKVCGEFLLAAPDSPSKEPASPAFCWLSLSPSRDLLERSAL